MKIDKKDKMIIQELMEDGRKTNLSLAELLGITAPACLGRMKKLNHKVINRYTVDIDWDAIGYSAYDVSCSFEDNKIKDVIEHLKWLRMAYGKLENRPNMYLPSSKLFYPRGLLALNIVSKKEYDINIICKEEIDVSLFTAIDIRRPLRDEDFLK